MARAGRVCGRPECPRIIEAGRTYCEEHKGPGTVARGYGAAHKRKRAEWVPKVRAGGVKCARCTAPILPFERWDLGHRDDDRSQYAGPEHFHCNRSAGGRASHGAEPVVVAFPRSREW